MLGQCAASSSSGRTRRCLVFLRGDEASPCLLAGEQGVTSSTYVVPRLPAGERGATSSTCAGTRHRLVFSHGNKALPRSPSGRRGVVLPRCEARRRDASSVFIF
ncbi:hypothetical protein BHM03_00019199 [Ensete ventricosum]|nr:hypothetical protein BHM03_00019199 [Ensete ventricosum]